MHAHAFKSADLMRCYAPPNLRSVMPGNKVMLRSGGPEMTVSRVALDGRAVCQYMEGSKLVQILLPLECLTCYGAK
jgi:hypothetical protein